MNYQKFKIKKNIWSFKGEYHVYDINDEETHLIEGKAFSFYSKFKFKNAFGEELFQIRRKVFTFKHTFFISKDGIDLFKIVKSHGFKPQIFVENLTDPDAFYVQGNLWGNEFKFYQDDVEFAYVSKDIWKMSDTYGVAVEEGRDAGLILAIVIIINIIKDIQESHS